MGGSACCGMGESGLRWQLLQLLPGGAGVKRRAVSDTQPGCFAASVCGNPQLRPFAASLPRHSDAGHGQRDGFRRVCLCPAAEDRRPVLFHAGAWLIPAFQGIECHGNTGLRCGPGEEGT